MAPPFEIVDKEYIEELKYNNGKVNKKKSTEYWPEDRFQKEGEWKKLPENLEEDESNVLDRTLSQFYAARNSVFFRCMLLTSNCNWYHLCFQTLLKFQFSVSSATSENTRDINP